MTHQPGIDDYRDALALTRAAAHNDDTEVRVVLTNCDQSRMNAAVLKLYLGQMLQYSINWGCSVDEVLDFVSANVEEAFAKHTRQDEQ